MSSNYVERSFGVIPVWRSDNHTRFLLVRHKAGHWSFPKGHAQLGESNVEAALRELREETGITDVQLITERTFTEQYRKPDVNHPAKLVDKIVQYYIGIVHTPHTRPQLSEVQECRWCELQEADALITFDESRRVLWEAAAALKLA
ncbi:MAG: bis(5'-nucleosyl)-tetraphosphatase [Thermoflexales bacterium]